MLRKLYPILSTLALTACATPHHGPETAVSIDYLTSAVRETAHRGNDDLVTAGLGLAGLRGAPAVPKVRRAVYRS